MEEKTIKIYEGTTEAFLVCDNSFRRNDAPFYKWLAKEGFSFGGRIGNYGCPWIHINITRKQYTYGKPGCKVVTPIGNHAITLQEFMTIYDIYKKYEGKEVLVFHKEIADYDQ